MKDKSNHTYFVKGSVPLSHLSNSASPNVLYSGPRAAQMPHQMAKRTNRKASRSSTHREANVICARPMGERVPPTMGGAPLW